MPILEQVSSKVQQYLWSEIGHMTGPGTPRFDEAAHIWHVSVLCDTERGIFPIGEIQLDEALNFIQLPSRAELEDAALRLLRAIPVLVYADPDELRAKGFTPVSN